MLHDGTLLGAYCSGKKKIRVSRVHFLQLQWRNQMTDEEWVELHASDDETWHRRVEQDFGMDTRPKNKPTATRAS